jgi:hypothetical protein
VLQIYSHKMLVNTLTGKVEGSVGFTNPRLDNLLSCFQLMGLALKCFGVDNYNFGTAVVLDVAK